jgi:two-component system nitrate/nitrite response regulator NarL
MSDALRIAVLADDPLARVGLSALLEDQGAHIVAQFAPSPALSDELEANPVQALVWDVGMTPDDSTIASLSENHVPVLALVMDETSAQESASALLSLPAYGVVQRHSAPVRLFSALSTLAQGFIIIDPAFATHFSLSSKRALSHLEDEEGTDLALTSETLTPREREVLALLAQGLANKTIARTLGITDHTVKYHVNAIMGKLGAQSRTDAVVRATRAGWVTL